MPLITIYHPPTTFTTPESKQSLATAITNVYGASLPAFYVNVIFIPIPADSFYVSGVPRPSPHTAANEPGPNSSTPFIRITFQHIARTPFEDKELASRFMSKVDLAIKPHVQDQGYDWEYSILYSSRNEWKIQGLVPPMPNTEAEKSWKEGNRPVPYEE